VNQAEVLIECAGQRYTLPTRPHKGSPADPCTWKEVCDKFRRFTGQIIGGKQAEALIAAVGSLEQIADMAEVAQLMALT
jgi:hypothetical protein